MTITRRKLITIVAVLGLGLSLPALEGCPNHTQQNLAAVLGIAGPAIAQVANLEGNTQLSQTLLTDFAAAQRAVENWKPGTPTQSAIQVLQIVEKDLNLFPPGQYQVYVALALGTVQSIIEVLAPPVSTTPSIQAHTISVRATTLTPATFKSRWNAAVAADRTGSAPPQLQ